MRTNLRRAASAVGIAALVCASVALGSTSAHAGNPINDCSAPGSIGTLVNAETAGAWWYDVCVNTTVIDEGETTNKTDGLDGFGYIFVDGVSDPVAAVPTSYGYIGADYVIEYTDAGFDLGGGDLVDIVVTQTFSGTFVRWEINFFDAGTTNPRTGIVFTIEGDLGCDSDCLYDVSGNQMVTYGDSNDPVIVWEIDSAGYMWDVADGDGYVYVDMETDAVLTMALVDYGCGATDVVTYAASLLAGGLDVLFGQSLQEPGTVDCVTVGGPLEITTGQVFSYVVPLTLLTPPWDWAQGGDTGSNYEPAFVNYQSLNAYTDDVEPGFRVFGTAPAAPGTYTLPVTVYSVEDDLYSRGFLTIIVSARTLPATGTEIAAPLVVGTGITVLGAIALALVARRRVTG